MSLASEEIARTGGFGRIKVLPSEVCTPPLAELPVAEDDFIVPLYFCALAALASAFVVAELACCPLADFAF